MIKECCDYVRDIGLATSPQVENMLEKIEEPILAVAKRKCYGIKRLFIPESIPPESYPPQSAFPEHIPKESLCCWEMQDTNMIEVYSLRDINARRAQRMHLGQRIRVTWERLKTIEKVVIMLIKVGNRSE